MNTSALGRMFKQILLCLLIFFNQGCSWMLVDSVPEEPVWNSIDYTTCNTSRAGPVVDTVFTVSTGINVAIGYIVSLPFMLLWGSSAFYGFDNTRKCENLKHYIAVKKLKEDEDEDEEYKKLLDTKEKESSVIEKPVDKGATPSNVMKKAKKCQKKGGVWINDRCEIDLTE